MYRGLGQSRQFQRRVDLGLRSGVVLQRFLVALGEIPENAVAPVGGVDFHEAPWLAVAHGGREARLADQVDDDLGWNGCGQEVPDVPAPEEKLPECPAEGFVKLWWHI